MVDAETCGDLVKQAMETSSARIGDMLFAKADRCITALDFQTHAQWVMIITAITIIVASGLIPQWIDRRKQNAEQKRHTQVRPPST